MKKVIFTILFLIACCSLVFADKVTLTTYYPAPFGMYQEMRVMGLLGVGEENPTHKVEIIADGAGQGVLVAGIGNTASNMSSALGSGNTASGSTSFATGDMNSSTGASSFSTGSGNTVSGLRAFASGFSNTASGETSFASGDENVVSGENSSAFGSKNDVDGISSFAAGSDNAVSGDNSFATGESNTVSNTRSFAFGFKNAVSSEQSAAFGEGNIVSNEKSFAFGEQNNAIGRNTFAAGINVTAKALGSSVFGRFNLVRGTEHLWKNLDPLFVIGNGTNDANRSDAVAVLKNGDVGIGVANPVSRLDVSDGTITLGDGNISSSGDNDRGIFVKQDGVTGGDFIGLSKEDPSFPVHVGLDFGGISMSSATLLQVDGRISSGHIVVGGNDVDENRNIYVYGYAQFGTAQLVACNATRAGSVRVAAVPAGSCNDCCALEVCYPGEEYDKDGILIPGGPGYTWKGACHAVKLGAASPPGGSGIENGLNLTD
ncbi:MAG: hypothetical protein PHY73_00370 [Candidatus Omnitrophica bacterium]|nr:hypothetical protein [Candidatus Omnitrophota bacterium]